MKKLILIMLVGFLCNSVVAQTTSDKTENVKTEQTVKKCSADKAKKSCSKDAKIAKKTEANASCSAKKESCSKDNAEKSASKKCTKGDACCKKTGEKVANCDKKKQGCCKASANPSK